MNKRWMPVKGYEGVYIVCEDSTVMTVERIHIRHYKSKNRNILQKVKQKVKVANLNKFGYLTIGLVSKNITHNTYLHRIIAEAFIPNPNNNKVVNHLNGIKTDNRLENLEWTTSSLNNIHALDNYLRTSKGVVDYTGYKRILKLKELGLNNTEICKATGHSYGSVLGITSGKTYKRMRSNA